MSGSAISAGWVRVTGGAIVVMMSLSLLAQGAATGPVRSRPRLTAAEPLVCDGCTPPLMEHGGPTMGTSVQKGEVTITPIYWKPAGFSIPAKYSSVIDTYIANIAAASHRTDNVYSVNTEYSRMKYVVHAGPSMVDASHFPAGGCTPDAGYKACVTDSHIQDELRTFTSHNKLPSGLGYLYPVFFPNEVQVEVDPDGEKSGADFCAYHLSTQTASKHELVYAVEPYGNICPSGQVPNGDQAADTQIDTLSHEIMEAITDPLANALADSSGHENGDMCTGNYGPPLGSTDPKNPKTTRYNQLINGGKYYTQTNFSNASYHVGTFGGCVQSEAQVVARRKGAVSPSLNTAIVRTARYRLPADGASTSTITATVLGPKGAPVAGDDVTFRSATTGGTRGTCGSLNPSSGTVAMTDSNGLATVTYRASSDNVSCDVVATEGATGQSDQVVISQGTTSDHSPRITVAFPKTLTVGSAPEKFTATVSNPSSIAFSNARISFTITGNGATSRGVDASHVHLSFSDRATKGKDQRVTLTGSTIGGGQIEGILTPNGSLFPARTSDDITFRIAVDHGAGATSVTGAPLHIETDLDQINPADGSLTTLDGHAGDTTVKS